MQWQYATVTLVYHAVYLDGILYVKVKNTVPWTKLIVYLKDMFFQHSSRPQASSKLSKLSQAAGRRSCQNCQNCRSEKSALSSDTTRSHVLCMAYGERREGFFCLSYLSYLLSYLSLRMIAWPGTYFKIKDIRDTRGTKNVREEEPDIGSGGQI